MELAKYNAACKAIAEAKSVDEIMSIRDKADALRAAARIAKNKQAEIDMAEIRFRAERHLGEMLRNGKDERAHEGGYRKKNDGFAKNPSSKPTLKEAGIDKNLADRARKLASVPDPEFERQVKDWREDIERSSERVILDLLRRGQSRQTKEEVKTAHLRAYDQRVKHFLGKIKNFMKEVRDAKTCRDNFSPEAAGFTVRQLIKLDGQVTELKKELTAKRRQQQEGAQ